MATLYEAKVNGQIVWRVYLNRELVATFNDEPLALQYVNFLNKKNAITL